MRIELDVSALHRTRWSEYAVRFLFGGIVTAATGLVALLVGLIAQMMSATREERIIIVTGIIAAFVGLCLGLAHGGFSG